jgi:hypothetical protein
MLIALAFHRTGHAARVTALAGVGGVALALTLHLTWDALAARAGSAPPLALLGTIPTPTVAVLVTGLLGSSSPLDSSSSNGAARARAWVDFTAWRLYAAVQDPETARELSQLCGEHGVLATSEGDTRGTSRRWGDAASSSTNRSEIRRPLIKLDKLLQDARADEAFVIARGHKPLRCGRAIYFRRPEMVAQVVPSRFQAPTGPRPPSSSAVWRSGCAGAP